MRSGMRRLEKKLKEMPGRIEKRMDVLLAACAQEAARQARALAPVDSGELKRGISAVQDGPLAATVVSAAPHGVMVEYGTSRMQSQPYMLPMAQGMRAQFFESALMAAREALK